MSLTHECPPIVCSTVANGVVVATSTVMWLVLMLACDLLSCCHMTCDAVMWLVVTLSCHWTCDLWQSNAELAVREMLKEIAHRKRRETGVARLSATDCLDDGTRMCLNITIDETQVTSVMWHVTTGSVLFSITNIEGKLLYTTAFCPCGC